MEIGRPRRTKLKDFEAADPIDLARCGLREGADGERVLMLHELQSDSMQSARRDMREHENGADAPRNRPQLSFQ